VKSITAREIVVRVPEVKKQLWGGNFWSNGYFISSVGKNGTETTVQEYVKNQGTKSQYNQLHQDQLRIFD
jgi:REP element-mobilizing transposase RayT